MQVSTLLTGPNLDLLKSETLGQKDPTTCVLTSPLGDSDARLCVRPYYNRASHPGTIGTRLEYCPR